jgi:hypothetical protein
MFRFTQEPSSGSSPVLSYNYKYGFSVLVGIDAVNVMAAYQPAVQACGCRHNIDCVYTDEHRKTILVVLAKHRTAP